MRPPTTPHFLALAGFAAAVAGNDYADLSGPATTVSFAEGIMTKTVIITLVPQTGLGLPNKHFTATIGVLSCWSRLRARRIIPSASASTKV